VDLGLKGRLVLVTGASGDVGSATAALLAAEGAALALTGRDQAALAHTASVAREHGRQVETFPADLGDEARVAALIAQVEERMGPIHGVANTVGPMRRVPGEPQLYGADELWRFHFEHILMPAVRIGRKVLPLMKARGAGAVVNLAATSARYYTAGIAAYASMKAALAHVTKDFARDAGPHGVRVNCVHPGWINKESTKNMVRGRAGAEGVAEQVVVEALLREHADDQYYTRRFGEPAEYARVIAFLLSDQASYVNGAWLAVDGGHCAG
jgi:NAD(P)-dependent dehydrogenase (short-subunit alcohol dehydrogenase family)